MMLNDAEQSRALRITVMRFIKAISVNHFNRLKFNEEIYDICPEKMEPVLGACESRFYFEIMVQNIRPGRRVCAV